MEDYLIQEFATLTLDSILLKASLGLRVWEVEGNKTDSMKKGKKRNLISSNNKYTRI